MFASTEDHDKKLLFNTTPVNMSSIRIGEMMNSVHNSSQYVDMTGDMAFLSSEILSFILCKSAKRVQNTFLFKYPHKKKLRADRSGERAGQEM